MCIRDRKSHAITLKFHTPTLIYLSTPESTAIYGVPSTRNQAQKNESYEETPTCVLRHRNRVQSPLSGWQNINPLSYLLSLLRQNGLQRADNLSYLAFTSTIEARGVSHSKTMVYFERAAQLCYHAILEVRGGIAHPHTLHPQSLAPIEQVLSRNLGCASLGWLQGNEIR